MELEIEKLETVVMLLILFRSGVIGHDEPNESHRDSLQMRCEETEDCPAAGSEYLCMNGRCSLCAPICTFLGSDHPSDDCRRECPGFNFTKFKLETKSSTGEPTGCSCDGSGKTEGAPQVKTGILDCVSDLDPTALVYACLMLLIVAFLVLSLIALAVLLYRYASIRTNSKDIKPPLRQPRLACENTESAMRLTENDFYRE